MQKNTKTTAQRASEALELIQKVTGLPLPGTEQYQELLKKLTITYKQQDRDTRHACAENVNKCTDWNECGDLSSTTGALISANEAHSACMNTNIT